MECSEVMQNNIVYQRLNEDFDTVLETRPNMIKLLEWIISPV
jgi:hypothetical protein